MTTLLLPLAQPFAVLLAVVVGNGLIGSTVGSISDGMIAQMATRRQINYGKMRLWGSAGWVAMSLLGGFLWPLFGLWLMFPLASLLFVATMFAARLLGEDGSRAKMERQPLRLTSGRGLLDRADLRGVYEPGHDHGAYLLGDLHRPLERADTGGSVCCHRCRD